MELCAGIPLRPSPPGDFPLRGTPREVEESDPDRPPCRAKRTDLPAGNIPSRAMADSGSGSILPLSGRTAFSSGGGRMGSDVTTPEMSASMAVGSWAGAAPSTGQGDIHSCAGAAGSTVEGGPVSCGGCTGAETGSERNTPEISASKAVGSFGEASLTGAGTGDSSGTLTTMCPPHFRQRIRAPFSPLSSATSRRKWAPQSPHVMSINDNACTPTASSQSGLQFAGSPSRRKYRQWRCPSPIPNSP